MIYALVGNQNCGKTTLFNQLTGSNQHVGNFPGVTVDQKVGRIDRRAKRHGKSKTPESDSVVDLPGIYSLRPYTSEEIVTRDFILNQKPDGIINIVDATNIERNLYLTLQLIELHIPMVLALNMMDELRGNNGSIDTETLSCALGIPVVPISAAKNEGIDELIAAITHVAEEKIAPARYDFCSAGPVHRCIHAVTHMIEDHAERAGVFPRFAAVKLVEGDSIINNRLKLNENELEMIEHSVKEMESESGLDRNEALADMRYDFITELARETVVKSGESKEHKRSSRIDRVLTNKYAAIPLFVCAMLLIFYLTFNVIGGTLSDLLTRGIEALTVLVDQGLTLYGLNPVVHGLIIDGVFAGVGSVLSFLPIIVTLFFFLSILEDTGYMARVAYVMDKLLRKIGLSGRSIVPLLIGFGCSVPAIMATRTLASERDRKLTLFLTPFMSCPAKIAIYAMFTAAFFERYQALVMGGLYVLGIIVAIIVALIAKIFDRSAPVPFVMELPNYRFPQLKSVCILMWEKAKEFLKKAFTIILLASVAVWILGAFDVHLNVAASDESSLLAIVGQFIAPIFKPLGFADWRVSTALITGLTAKETVVSTLTVLVGTDALSSIFTPLSAMSFMVFTLLYTPCVAAIGAMRRELNSAPLTLAAVVLECVIAWVVSFLVYQIGSLFL